MTIKHKYQNQPTVLDGIRFDSKREANRYAELKILEKAKVISNLQLQVAFPIIPAQTGGLRKELAASYVADFVYMENGKQIIEDTKGVKTKDYLLKRKLMKLQGLEITEV